MGINLLLKEYGKLYSLQSRECTSSNLTDAIDFAKTINPRESEASFLGRRVGTNLIRPTHPMDLLKSLATNSKGIHYVPSLSLEFCNV